MVSKETREKLRQMFTGKMSPEEYARVREEIRNGEGAIGQLFRRLDEQEGGCNAETMLLSGLDEAKKCSPKQRTPRLDTLIDDPVKVAAEIEASSPGSGLTSSVLAAIKSGQQELDYVTAVTLSDHLQVSLEDLLGRNTPGGAYLKTGKAPTGSRPSSDSTLTSPLSTDAMLELEDFLGRGTAESMVQAWQSGSEQFQTWLQAAMRSHDEYDQLKIQLLAAISLTKNHRDADKYDDMLVQVAGDDDARRMDALFLRGRSRWYINQEELAVDDLHSAFILAEQQRNPVRQAQCALYLSRLAIKTPDKFGGDDAARFAALAQDLAIRGGRPDIQLLAIRGEVIRLRNTGNMDGALALARQAISEESRWKQTGLDRIFRALQIYYGVCLRNIGDEASRVEAEQLYERMTESTDSEQDKGMVGYLWADLYIDRLQAAWQAAIEATSVHESETQLKRAAEFRERAISLCEASQKQLARVGDIAAERKAVQRLVALKGQSIKLPGDNVDVNEDLAARQQEATAILLDNMRIDESGVVVKSKGVDAEKLSHFLNAYFSGLVRLENKTYSHDLDVKNFLDRDTLLVVPWGVGESMVVRVFAAGIHGEPIQSLGLFSIQHARSLATRRAIKHLVEAPESAMPYATASLFQTLQGSILTADSLVEKERQGYSHINHVIVLPPQSPQDWAIPLEWLETQSDKSSRAVPLLDFARRSVIFSGFRGNPLAAAKTPLDAGETKFLATTQAYGEQTIAEHCRSAFGNDVEAIEIDSGRSVSLDCQSLFLFAHDDQEHSIGSLIDCWDWSAVKVAVLLFCSSGQYTEKIGPFVDGAAFQIQRRLATGGVVVAARVPVTLDEAIKFSQSLLDEPDSNVPIAQRVTRYLRLARRNGSNPFVNPWITIG